MDRIERGIYGPVEVQNFGTEIFGNTRMAYIEVSRYITATEAREASETFKRIADTLDAMAKPQTAPEPRTIDRVLDELAETKGVSSETPRNAVRDALTEALARNGEPSAKSGWFPNLGKCPVPAGTRVWVRTGDGIERTVNASGISWVHFDEPSANITHWKLV